MSPLVRSNRLLKMTERPFETGLTPSSGNNLSVVIAGLDPAIHSIEMSIG
jgi:hypothetical protein